LEFQSINSFRFLFTYGLNNQACSVFTSYLFLIFRSCSSYVVCGIQASDSENYGDCSLLLHEVV